MIYLSMEIGVLWSVWVGPAYIRVIWSSRRKVHKQNKAMTSLPHTYTSNDLGGLAEVNNQLFSKSPDYRLKF